MRVLHLDCSAGAAGDMILAALLDVGASQEAVRSALHRLDLDGWTLEVNEVARGGLRARRADVIVTDDKTARRVPEILEIVSAAGLEPDIDRRALAAFDLLARAEARVHGRGIDELHLHETGAIDALVDIVGASAALVSLEVERITASEIPLGSGTITTAHGILPVPAPATVEILKGVPVTTGGEGEVVTPTGAALLVANCDGFGAMPAMTLEATGYGAGARDAAHPNVTRAFVGEATRHSDEGAVLIETNIDDMAPELVAHLIDASIAAGADDAWITPIVMKKSRPAHIFSALCHQAAADRVAETIFRESTTFGLRTTRVSKQALERSWTEVEVAGHAVRVKTARRGGTAITTSVEYEDALRVSKATGMPVKDVYSAALRALEPTRL